MPKKKEIQPKRPVLPPLEPTPQPITDTLRKNYMPYAMSVIVSRAIPEIDGFKPSHRKLLYTMYKMGLLNGKLTSPQILSVRPRRTQPARRQRHL